MRNKTIGLRLDEGKRWFYTYPLARIKAYVESIPLEEWGKDIEGISYKNWDLLMVYADTMEKVNLLTEKACREKDNKKLIQLLAGHDSIIDAALNDGLTSFDKYTSVIEAVIKSNDIKKYRLLASTPEGAFSLMSRAETVEQVREVIKVARNIPENWDPLMDAASGNKMKVEALATLATTPLQWKHIGSVATKDDIPMLILNLGEFKKEKKFREFLAGISGDNFIEDPHRFIDGQHRCVGTITAIMKSISGDDKMVKILIEKDLNPMLWEEIVRVAAIADYNTLIQGEITDQEIGVLAEHADSAGKWNALIGGAIGSNEKLQILQSHQNETGRGVFKIWRAKGYDIPD